MLKVNRGLKGFDKRAFLEPGILNESTTVEGDYINITDFIAHLSYSDIERKVVKVITEENLLANSGFANYLKHEFFTETVVINIKLYLLDHTEEFLSEKITKILWKGEYVSNIDLLLQHDDLFISALIDAYKMHIGVLGKGSGE